MSRTTIYGAPENGTFQSIAELPNAWGSAPRVWSALCARWFGDDTFWLRWSEEEQKQLWALAKDDRLTPAERVVHASTFDRVLVRRDEWPRLALYFREFDRLYPVPANVVNHLPAQADMFEQLAGGLTGLDFTPFAVGWWQTSVTENPWIVRVGEDDYRPYDLAKDEGHWFLFDHVQCPPAS